MSLNKFIIKIYSVTNLMVPILYYECHYFIKKFSQSFKLFDSSKNENCILSWTDRVLAGPSRQKSRPCTKL
jgi:hypothetical protein